MPATAVCVRPEALELLAMKGGDAVTPERPGEAVINQWGKDPPEEGPSHLGSWRPPPGETRPAKRRDNVSREASKSAVRSIKRSLPRRDCHPGNRARRSRAQTYRAKATEGVKSLGAQYQRTSRRRGRGMWTRLVRELERPSRAWRGVSRARNGVRISQKRNRDSARRASDGVEVPVMAVQHNAAGGKDPCFVRASHAGKRG